MNLNFVTLFYANYSAKGIALCRSIERVSPKSHLYVFAMDEVCFKILKSIELNPNYTLAYFNMGRAYQAMGEKTRSAEYYQMAIDLNKITNELNEQDILERLHKLFE